jgi:hypothetical protein
VIGEVNARDRHRGQQRSQRQTPPRQRLPQQRGQERRAREMPTGIGVRGHDTDDGQKVLAARELRRRCRMRHHEFERELNADGEEQQQRRQTARAGPPTPGHRQHHRQRGRDLGASSKRKERSRSVEPGRLHRLRNGQKLTVLAAGRAAGDEAGDGQEARPEQRSGAKIALQKGG